MGQMVLITMPVAEKYLFLPAMMTALSMPIRQHLTGVSMPQQSRSTNLTKWFRNLE